MKMLSNLSAAVSDLSSPLDATRNQGARSVQSQAGFWRHIRFTKSGPYFESSAGGRVFIPESELWKLAEQHDANLVTPKT